MPCYRCGAREADPARGSRLWVRAVRADVQVLVCPECQESASWPTDVDHCSTCDGTNLVRRLGETVCRSCESSATAEFLAVESTTDRGVAVSNGGRHRRADDDGSRDLTTEVASAIDRVLGKHAKRPAEDEQMMYPPDDGEGDAPATKPASQSVPGSPPATEEQPEREPAGPPRDDGGEQRQGRGNRFGRGRRR